MSLLLSVFIVKSSKKIHSLGFVLELVCSEYTGYSYVIKKKNHSDIFRSGGWLIFLIPYSLLAYNP